MEITVVGFGQMDHSYRFVGSELQRNHSEAAVVGVGGYVWDSVATQMNLHSVNKTTSKRYLYAKSSTP